MRKLLSGIFLLSLFYGCASTNNTISADYIFENVNIISMDNESVLKDKALAVKDGKIIAIVDQSKSKNIKAGLSVNGESRYLMPGLADMHVHVRWNPQAMFNLFLANGVTTVANMWLGDGKGASIDHLDLREQIASGKMLGPRYLVSGDHLQENFPGTLDEVDRVLNEHQERGIDFVKVHGDLPIKIYDALIAGAKKRQLKIIGHAQHNMPLQKTLELDVLEHMEELLYVSLDKKHSAALTQDFLSAYRDNVKRLRDPEYRKLVVDEIVKSDIVIDPTLIVYKMVGVWSSDTLLTEMRSDPSLKYLPKKVKDKWLSLTRNPYQEEGFPINRDEVESNLEVMYLLTKELHDAGVPLLLGTDTFGTLIPGISVHQELALLVESGLSPYEALKAGTVNVAQYLNETDSSGKIKEGYEANFILLERNPLVDIQNSKSVNSIFHHKHWYNQEELAELLINAQNSSL